jgi:hypothetical protein
MKIMKNLIEFIRSLFKPPVAYYTTDGGHLAPYPNMTDEELRDFEYTMCVPNPTWPEL